MNGNNHPTHTRTERLLPMAPFAHPFPDNPLASALAVSDDLSAALARHGITLPSLRPDLASSTTTAMHRPLLELGRVNLSTAHRLTLALTVAADACEATAHPRIGIGGDSEPCDHSSGSGGDR